MTFPLTRVRAFAVENNPSRHRRDKRTETQAAGAGEHFEAPDQ